MGLRYADLRNIDHSNECHDKQQDGARSDKSHTFLVAIALAVHKQIVEFEAGGFAVYGPFDCVADEEPVRQLTLESHVVRHMLRELRHLNQEGQHARVLLHVVLRNIQVYKAVAGVELNLSAHFQLTGFILLLLQG